MSYTMPKRVKRTLMLIAAVFFILVGITGFILPIMPGILFLALGIILLSLYSPSMREWLEKHTRKFPKLHAMIQKAETTVVRIIGES